MQFALLVAVEHLRVLLRRSFRRVVADIVLEVLCQTFSLPTAFCHVHFCNKVVILPISCVAVSVNVCSRKSCHEILPSAEEGHYYGCIRSITDDTTYMAKATMAIALVALRRR